jgi:hypothetical protein
MKKRMRGDGQQIATEYGLIGIAAIHFRMACNGCIKVRVGPQIVAAYKLEQEPCLDAEMAKREMVSTGEVTFTL